MTCLIDRVLSGAGIKSHTFMLGTLGSMYADFQEKEISGKNFQTFHCSNVSKTPSQCALGKIF